MLVKDMSGKELREFHGKSRRMADLIRSFPQKALTNNSPATPFLNVEAKRPRLEVSSSPPVQVRGSSQPSLSGVDEMWTSFYTQINGSGGGDGDATSIWDDHFPFGELIEKHFRMEKYHEKVKELELESALQTSLADCFRTTFLLRVIGRKFGDMEKEKKTYVGEITELKKKLSESEKNMAQMTSLKDELNKLKKTLEESNLEKSQLVAREKDLMEENSKIRLKSLIKEDANKITIEKLKAEIEELKGEISLQYKAGYGAGYDKAVKQVVFFASQLKP